MSSSSFGMLKRCACRLDSNLSSSIQARGFRSSAAWLAHGPVPKFRRTDNPELNERLSDIRDLVFIPSHLNSQQQELVYGTKNQKLLEVEGVTVDIEGEEFQLRHIDRTKDLPDPRDAIHNCLNLMGPKSEWENLPILLEGYHTARDKKPLEIGVYGSIVRRTALASRQNILLACLKSADKTGFTLQEPEVSSMVIWAIQREAAFEKWDPVHTQKAFSRAEEVAELMERPEHQRTLQLMKDSRRNPVVIGTILELAAAHAKHQNDNDSKADVRKYALRFLANLQDFDKGNDVTHTFLRYNLWLENMKFEHRHGPRIIANRLLQHVSPVLHGLQLAMPILSEDPKNKAIVEKLQDVAERIGESVSRARKICLDDPEHCKAGLATYDITFSTSEQKA